MHLSLKPVPPPGKSGRHWRWDRAAGEHRLSWADAGAVIGPRRTVAWRVLDAQYFGLAQRRRRVFVVASARPDFDPVAVLLEFDGVRRDLAPRREAREEAAGTLAGGARQRGGYSHDDIPLAGTLTAGMGRRGAEDPERGLTVPTIDASFGRLQGCSNQDANHGHGHLVAFGGNCTGGPVEAAALNCNGGQRSGDFEAGTLLVFDTTQITSATNRSQPQAGDPCHPLAAGAHPPAVAFHGSQDPDVSGDVTHPMSAQTNGLSTSAMVGSRVRRLTPEECEALQGFPRGYTAIPWRGKPAAECPDGPRYKALGNSWPVPVVRWIGQRIARAAA